MSQHKSGLTRRDFLRNGMAAAALAGTGPMLLSACAHAQKPASDVITMGCIGVGRQGSTNMNGFLAMPDVRVVAVCDVDSKRAQKAKERVESKYADLKKSGAYKGCDVYEDYREIVARKDIDVMLVCTPDHWHVLNAIAAIRAGKDVYLEKPMAYTIAEGRALSDAVKKHGRILQMGSQQRSEDNFRFACELARNGRIGKVHTVKVGLPGDPSNGQPPEMPVPPNLNYEFWLGPAPLAPYTEERVHPQADYSRPGWLRVYDYCHGMITGWGTHHNDIAQWALGTEMTGPVEIDGHAVFPKDSLWDVHSDDYRIEYTYADGRKLITAGQKYNRAGVTLVGSDAEIWVDRGKLESTKPEILKEKIGPNEIHLYESNDHKRNFIDCVRSRKEPVAPVEIGHRSCTVCLLGSHSMKLGRKLRWNPEKEEILDDAEASKMLARQMRTPWSLEG